MKNTIKKLGIVALVAIIGLTAVTCATFGIGPKLPHPENITVTQTVSPRTITVTWDAVEGATEYVVQIVGLTRSTVRGTTFTFTSTASTAIAPARNYDVRVAANRRAIDGDYSPSVSVTTLPATPAERLPVPSNVTATATAWNTVTVTWGASAGATGYRVTQGSNTWTVTGTSHTVSNLNGNTSYTFVVTPLINNDAGTSARGIAVTTPRSPQQQAELDRAQQQRQAEAERQQRAAEAETARITALNNNANFQRLRGGTFGMSGHQLMFPNDATDQFILSPSGGSTMRFMLQTVTANQVTGGDNTAGFSFNYVLNANGTLTVTNFHLIALSNRRPADQYNLTYVRSR